MNIKEMAFNELPININIYLGFDTNEYMREGYILGANAVLREIETRIEMGRHACMQTPESILDSIEMTIKELKGGEE